MCVCVAELDGEVSRARKGSTLFNGDKERERGGDLKGGVIAKHGSNSEKRNRNREEEEEGSGIEGTCERYR